MRDPVGENDEVGTGATWCLKQFEGQSVADLNRPIAFELTDAHGTILASVCIPPKTIDELLRPHLSIFAELQLDGSVSLDSEFFALFPPPATADILELVKEALAFEMLEDELDVKERLATLRQRLSEALALVDQTLTNLDKPVA